MSHHKQMNENGKNIEQIHSYSPFDPWDKMQTINESDEPLLATMSFTSFTISSSVRFSFSTILYPNAENVRLSSALSLCVPCRSSNGLTGRWA